jgi:Fe-Mn family superoxide dismutase
MEDSMRYTLAPIHCRPWMLQGLSQKLIESHYENNYGGALRRLNAITEQLEGVDFAKAPGYLVNSLKREELVALNSVLLHELYFASLAQSDGKPTSAMAESLERDFGSVDRWRGEFMAMGYALGGGSGWVLLTWSPRDRRLLNQYAAEHTQAVAGAIPILALDMFEHAYHIDFGANVRAYVETFMRNLDWTSVEFRYGNATRVAPLPPVEQPEYAGLPAVSPEEVRAMMGSRPDVQLIDARPRFYASRTQDIAEGAVWKDPERVKEWAGELDKGRPVVVFCAYGFHVGCNTTIALREAGFDASFMKGGHSAWKAIGGPINTRPS